LDTHLILGPPSQVRLIVTNGSDSALKNQNIASRIFAFKS
jgi:hypothetical protein